MHRLLTIILCSILLLPSCKSTQVFTAIRSAEGLEVREKGKKVFFYQQRPKTINGMYERAGYIHPLYSLNEKVLTENGPEDHPFHRGIFWAWHQILFNNQKIADGWVSENISWHPVNVKIHSTRNQLVLDAEVVWRSSLNNKDTTNIIKERTSITVHRSTSHYRVIDFNIRLFALVDSLGIGGSDDAKGYGGFSLRLHLPADISFISGNGEVMPTETALRAGYWMDFNGSFEGDSASKTGIAVFDGPRNPAHSPLWILRKEKSMQNIPYPGRTPVPLSKNGWDMNYRLVIHDNEIGNHSVDSLYREYIRKH